MLNQVTSLSVLIGFVLVWLYWLWHENDQQKRSDGQPLFAAFDIVRLAALDVHGVDVQKRCSCRCIILPVGAQYVKFAQ